MRITITIFLIISLISSIIVISPQPIQTKEIGQNSMSDRTRPMVKITNPSYTLTIYTNKSLIINGTASDFGSGIQKVEGFIHTFPFNNNYSYKLANPIAPENWSKWSFPVMINNTGTYRLSIRATDNAGNENWTEVMVNFPFWIGATNSYASAAHPKIAFIYNSFTKAAYSSHGFYTFYYKYKFPPFGVRITNDLDMLTTNIPHQRADEKSLSNLTALITSDPDDRKYWIPFTEHVERIASNSTITIIRDEDVNDDKLFGTNGKNLYNILILLHNEYVTQKEYDNFKRFVNNGGTIIFLDANIFYAQVRYDKDNQKVTLVKGHDWEFDGKAAQRSVSERWYNETKEWVGGNYLVADKGAPISFANNPFNYTHFEEQFVNNLRDHEIIDYKAKYQNDKRFPLRIPENKIANLTIASYNLSYGSGQVIMVGLYGQNLADNEAFLKFYDQLISLALSPQQSGNSSLLKS
jgi:hypothetical protein